MRKEDVIDYFGNAAAVARALDYTEGAVSQWKDVIPELTARKLHDLTKGKLRFDSKLYQKRSNAA